MRMEPSFVRKALLVYDGLPVSHGGAHRLSRFEPERVLQYLSHFLETCTAGAILNCNLQLYVSTASADSPRDIKQLRKAAEREFGTAEYRGVASGPNREE